MVYEAFNVWVGRGFIAEAAGAHRCSSSCSDVGEEEEMEIHRWKHQILLYCAAIILQD